MLLPTLGSPTIPQFNAMLFFECSLIYKWSSRSGCAVRGSVRAPEI
ncbi:hypothetical protein ACP_2076 [Acidobacterium capsulatum ATCC 51196]|uniref:Uncharacterized protein n=1 Tax=Acidobacterium capsulatum (strain ATCC 51196 / DSM 11244 / BCRC 80197 / JCM 7670 / NBRC 15755 / NCIMB 13165 / 161) TaxID=240015 RepID=C1F913_ACIC5|nr:hypothetical protein ACP_2076 [Acidobacterium capsulatum ATCC 51196]